jgi:predicted ABC-type ATPase
MKLNFSYWFNEEWAGRPYNPKLIIVMGGQGSGKSHIAELFKTRYNFRLALLDQYFEALTRKKQGGGKVNVSIKNPQQKQDYIWAATKTDKRMDYYIDNGYPFVTEKTGQNYGTIATLKKMAEDEGYDVYGVYVEVLVELALARNAARPGRSLSDTGEIKATHQKVSSNMKPGPMGPGIPGLFGKNFYKVSGDGSPQSNAEIEKVVTTIATRPIENPLARKV